MSCVTSACMIPPVSTPFSTAARIEPSLRIVFSARMWCSWPCSTPRPIARSTPRLVPYSADSMSWVASALPANSTSTNPASTIATIAGAAPVWTTPGSADPEHLLAGGLRLAHAVGDLAHQHRLRLLRGDVGLHEAERLVALVGLRDAHLDARGTADDHHADPDVGHRQRVHPARGAVGVALEDQAAVHLRVADLQPAPLEPHPGLEVGGRVEPVGEDAVHLRLEDLGLAGVDQVDPWVCRRIRDAATPRRPR